ncbi:sensor histidine kinase [Runella zeae]|uniref:sensor histidine kinase n=1 Tax=Runella zeae TaxID=94255 RepID=UPI00146E3035|nr:HAMP domain-containing sensor histidine kinase [Runella zeae]
MLLLILLLVISKLRSKNLELQKALTEIQRLNKAKDYFLSIIAHDLRRPLSTLYEMAELADYYIKTHRYDSLRQVSVYIDQSGNKIRNMLDNMVHWALSYEGRYEPESLILKSKIDVVLALYDQEITKKQIHVDYQVPPLLTGLVDSNGFELVVRNLIDNALKHLPPKGSLRIEAKEISLSTVQLQIADNGRGIAREKVKELQYVLAKADELVPGQVGRTLGMLITGRFVKINKGTILIESELQKGTTLTITFPRSIES